MFYGRTTIIMFVWLVCWLCQVSCSFRFHLRCALICALKHLSMNYIIVLDVDTHYRD